RGGAARPPDRDRACGGAAGHDAGADRAGRAGDALHGGHRRGAAPAVVLCREGDGAAARHRQGGDAMSRIFPYPLMMASLVVVWLVLTSFSPGQLVVGVAVALLAGQGLAALHPVKPRLRRWDLIPKLVAIVLYDIVRSNIAVVSIILGGPRRVRRSGFASIPLELRDPTGLAVLSVIVTSTPGPARCDSPARR